MAQPKPTVTDWPYHHDPKNLWPTLAGLSLLVHLALFLIGLPLVIRLTQPEGEGGETVTVPIERVDPTAVDAPEDVLENNPETAPNSIPNDALANPSPTPGAEPATNAVPSTTPQPRPQQNSSSPTPTPIPTPTPAPRPSNSAPSPSPRPAPSPAPNPSPSPRPAPNPSPRPAPSPTPNPTPAPAPNPTPNPTPAPAPNPAPVPGGGTLPDPNDGSGQGSVFISVAGPLSRVPDNVPGDRPDQYPELQPPANDLIVIGGINQNCAPSNGLSLSGRTSLQVVISPNGTLTQALNANSPFEQFVACLLPKAGFQFSPARVGGTAVATDRVIITVEVSPGN